MRVKPRQARFGAPILAVMLASISIAGCGSIVQQGPSDALRAYSRALADGRVDDAYKLLSDEARRGMSLEAFRRAVKERPEDAAEIARALARPTGDPVVNATVTLPSGDELLLVFEGGRWRIDASAVELYGQATPRQALMGFLRAFERKRWDVILRYVPDAEREGSSAAGDDVSPIEPAKDPKAPPRDDKQAKDGKDAKAPAPNAPSSTELTADKIRQAWEGPQKEQINRIVQAIKTALPTAQIEETGDSAAMSYGAGGTVAFMREHGAWKIRDFWY